MPFYALENLANLQEGYRKAFNVAGHSLLLLHHDNQTRLLENRCPHMDAPLATGQVTDGAIICRAHGIAFSLGSGAAQGPLGDTIDCLKFYPLAYDGNKVGVEL